MPPQRQICVDALLEGHAAELIQPCDLALGERLIGNVGQRRPAPQREALP